nr:ANTAR domain-containing protein [Streptomyces sp. CBMA152]
MRRAIQTRPVIDLARGALMATFSLSRQDAWDVLVTVSQHSNSKLRQVAEYVLGSINGESLPEPLQQQLAAALVPFRTKPDIPTGTLNAPATAPDTAEAIAE